MVKISQAIKSNISFYVILIVISLFNALREPGLPGLYYDSVNPDFFALHLLNPGANNANLTNYIGIPFIGALYHGVVTMFFMLLAIVIAGKTSVTLVWLVNSIYGLIISFLLYKLLIRAGISVRSSKLCSIMLLLSPNMFAYYRTQFYILLPGAVFLMAAIWFALNLRETYINRDMILCGVFSGLAVYDYFVWLFWIPAVLIVLFYRRENLGLLEVLNELQIYIIASLTGCSFYLLGYAGGVLYNINNIAKAEKEILYVIVIISLYAVLGAMLYLQCIERLSLKKRMLIFYGALLLAIFAAAALLGIAFPLLDHQINRLEIFANKAGIAERIRLCGKYIAGVFDNSSGELYLLGETTSAFGNLIIVVVFALTLINVAVLIKSRNVDKKYQTMFFVLISALLFCLVSLPLVHRMGYHHFVAFCFAGYALLFINIDIASDNLGAWLLQYKAFGCLKVLPDVLVVLLMILCLVNQTRITLKMEETSGQYLYTENINILSARALENKHNGEKELYVFPEWGFKAGFNYLTMNEVSYCDDIDGEMLDKYLNDGYQIRLCLWKDDGDTKEFLRKAECLMAGKASEELIEMTGRRGDVDILIYEFSQNDMR